MKKKKLLELYKSSTSYSFVVPAETEVKDLYNALSFFIIQMSERRGISTETALAEIRSWVQRLDEK